MTSYLIFLHQWPEVKYIRSTVPGYLNTGLGVLPSGGVAAIQFVAYQTQRKHLAIATDAVWFLPSVAHLMPIRSLSGCLLFLRHLKMFYICTRCLYFRHTQMCNRWQRQWQQSTQHNTYFCAAHSFHLLSSFRHLLLAHRIELSKCKSIVRLAFHFLDDVRHLASPYRSLLAVSRWWNWVHLGAKLY